MTLPVVERLRNARMMVNYGHGDVRDEPDPLHEEAAAEIERLRDELKVEREIVANLQWAIEQQNARLLAKLGGDS
jgi:hypothetical protein